MNANMTKEMNARRDIFLPPLHPDSREFALVVQYIVGFSIGQF